MFLRRVWRSILIIIHLLLGYAAFYRAGGGRTPYAPAVREVMQRWHERLLALLNVEITVHGTVPHERERPMLMIANHVSWVDIPLIGSLTPVNFLSKAEVAKWPVVGSLAVKLGTLFISRGSGDTEKVMDEMADHLNKHLSMLFFPEGTTTDGSKIRRFHKKLFKVCDRTEVEVLPLLIRYHSVDGANPAPFVGDIPFGTHFWAMVGHKTIKASVEVMPVLKLDPENVGHQIKELELKMREQLAVGLASSTPN